MSRILIVCQISCSRATGSKFWVVRQCLAENSIPWIFSVLYVTSQFLCFDGVEPPNFESGYLPRNETSKVYTMDSFPLSIAITRSAGFAKLWPGQVRAATNRSKSFMMNRAISASCTDFRVRQWSEPPSVYINTTWGWTLSRAMDAVHSAMWAKGLDGVKTLSLRRTSTWPW